MYECEVINTMERGHTCNFFSDEPRAITDNAVTNSSYVIFPSEFLSNKVNKVVTVELSCKTRLNNTTIIHDMK